MANRWEQTAGGCFFRFFSPEQVDQILRDGARSGRAGSHAAIERILKHESEFQRADLWKRIRQLKNLAPRPKYRHVAWSAEDERILHEGYRNGWQGKRAAVHELVRRHPDWCPHTIWRHAGKLGLIKRQGKRGQERARRPWSEEDNGILLELAGYKSSRAIAKVLHRSEAAVRSRLCIMGKSSRVDLDGFSRHGLATDLHLSSSTIQRLIVQGLLEVRDPRITRESLDHLSKSGGLSAWLPLGTEASNVLPETVERKEISAAKIGTAPNSGDGAMSLNQSSRAKRVWGEVANSFGVPLAAVEQLIVRGTLKMYDPTVPESRCAISVASTAR